MILLDLHVKVTLIYLFVSVVTDALQPIQWTNPEGEKLSEFNMSLPWVSQGQGVSLSSVYYGLCV